MTWLGEFSVSVFISHQASLLTVCSRNVTELLSICVTPELDHIFFSLEMKI